jgi:beta-glucosidase
MSSFNTINGVPATANPFTLTQILRKEWGFDGFVVSDWGAVAELLNHSIGPDGPPWPARLWKPAWTWTWKATSTEP